MKTQQALTLAMLAGVVGIAANAVQAVQITALNTAFTQNFNSMSGNAMPADWTIAGAASTGTSATTLNATSGGNSYKFTSPGTDNAVGFLTSGSYSSPRSIDVSYTNNTGATLTSLALSFDYEKYRTGTRAFGWTFFANTGSGYVQQAFGTQNYAADVANGSSGTFNPPGIVNKSGTISGLNLAAGATAAFRWTMTGVGGSTNGQALAIDNFSLTAQGTLPNTAPTFTAEPYAITLDLASTTSFSFNGLATDVDTSNVLSVTADNVPSFATFSSTGGSFNLSASGLTPANVGTYTVDLSVADGAGGTDTSTVSIEIVNTAVPEPTTIGLLSLGALAALRRRRA